MKIKRSVYTIMLILNYRLHHIWPIDQDASYFPFVSKFRAGRQPLYFVKTLFLCCCWAWFPS